MQIQGILKGNHIELSQELNLPDGLSVTVEIHPASSSIEEKRRMIDSLCGSWAKDDSLTPIFDEIERNRRNAAPREVAFDAAS